MSEFVAGHRLSAALDAIMAPALDARLPGLRYATALVGHGSDVLGFDTERSRDHDWGPRLQIVLDEHDHERADEVLNVVEAVLPDTVLGVPVDLPGSADRPGGDVTHHNTAGRARHHGVTVTTVARLVRDLAGVDEQPDAWTPSTWLGVPSQALLELTAGPIHRDLSGALTATRTALAWYPDDVWRYVMAGTWQRIAQWEAFVGRAGEVDDDLGSRVVAAGIVRDAMRLALLQRRCYPAYPKWLGTQFARAEACTDTLVTNLAGALAAAQWQSREQALVAALVELGRRHDALGLSAPVRAEPSSYFTRPFTVVWGDRFVDALQAAITDSAVASLPRGLGGVDAVSDNTLVLGRSPLRDELAGLWRSPDGTQPGPFRGS